MDEVEITGSWKDSVAVEIQINGDWYLIFDGGKKDVAPAAVLLDGDLNEGSIINVAAERINKGEVAGSASTIIGTMTASVEDENLVVLSGSLEGRPLVVKIAFDTCDEASQIAAETSKNNGKTNNGHGNNLDGVDMSNPGKAPFMKYDSDSTVDDEGKGGGAYPANGNKK